MNDPDHSAPSAASPRPGDLAGVFEDLEQQAAGLHLSERDAELVDRVRGEYAAVSFASRVHASLDRHVALTLQDGQVVEGHLAGAGVDWCVVVPAGARVTWLVRLAAVVTAGGLSARAVPEAVRPAVARLGFGSALRRLAEESSVVALHLASGASMPVRVVRVGADFVEAATAGTEQAATSLVLVPFGAVLAAHA